MLYCLSTKWEDNEDAVMVSLPPAKEAAASRHSRSDEGDGIGRYVGIIDDDRVAICVCICICISLDADFGLGRHGGNRWVDRGAPGRRVVSTTTGFFS